MLRRLASQLLIAGRFSSDKLAPLSKPTNPAVATDQMMHNGWKVPDPTHTVPHSIKQVSRSTHLSNAEANIHRIPIIKVHTNVVRCMGGTALGAGHPMEYIQVNTKYGQPSTCKYCGLKYQLATHDDHSHDSHEHHEHKHIEGPQRGEQ